ncbi:hypothetical protein SAMN05216506_109191 [Saccharopolyspora kobensis]|uniref:Uncharacterized protein n=1 Tax=Saccharopolyspora kobensis TaxID=146035 RepID=A0ABY1E1W4_9PSEU|nr:hypothetical protein SAMN05216506_109191 [Saccharopolyspora kobensis]
MLEAAIEPRQRIRALPGELFGGVPEIAALRG